MTVRLREGMLMEQASHKLDCVHCYLVNLKIESEVFINHSHRDARSRIETPNRSVGRIEKRVQSVLNVMHYKWQFIHFIVPCIYHCMPLGELNMRHA